MRDELETLPKDYSWNVSCWDDSRKCSRWLEEEDIVLLLAVILYSQPCLKPKNLDEMWLRIAQLLPRSHKSARERWYNYLKTWLRQLDFVI